VLGLATSHAPSLHTGPEGWDGGKRDMSSPMGGGMKMDIDIEAMIEERKSWIDKELTFEVRKERFESCWRAINTLGEVYQEASPDVFVLVGDDTHEVFMPEDHIPAIDVFWGETLPYLPHPSRLKGQQPTARDLQGQPDLGGHIVESLLADEFDISSTRNLPEGRYIGHAFDFVYGCVLGNEVGPHVPIWLNTYYPPNQPSLKRCHDLGRGLRRAIESWDSDKTVAVMATGGMSHLILDEELDRTILAAMKDKDEKRLTTTYPDSLFTYGTSEIRNWTVLAGAMADSDASMELLAYEPMYRSPAGTGCGCAFAYWQ
jgi:3-O-methylgallate 3,4-dioxygenase